MVFPWYEFEGLVPVEALPPQPANTSANSNATPRATLLISLFRPFPPQTLRTAYRAALPGGDRRHGRSLGAASSLPGADRCSARAFSKQDRHSFRTVRG